jgi:hypothetical protein
MKVQNSLILLVLGLHGCSDGTGGTGGIVTPPTPNMIAISGQANKGPFAVSADVTVQAVSAAGALSASVTSSTTEDGGFSVNVEEDSVNLITVEGTYFSEITGEFTEDSIAISGVFAGGVDDDANVNVLTHLIHDRVLDLMANGSEADAAINTAQDELTLALRAVIPSPTTAVNFNELVVLNALQEEPTTEGNGYLLALSSIFEQHALLRSDTSGMTARAELIGILDSLAEDLKSDGVLDLSGTEEDLVLAQRSLNPDEIHQNLFEFDNEFKQRVIDDSSSAANADDLDCTVSQENVRCFTSDENSVPSIDAEVEVNASLTSIVADMNTFIDSDGDGVVNASDDDDDGDGIIDSEDSRPFDAILLVPANSSEQFATYVKAGLRQWSWDNVKIRSASSGPFEDDVEIAVPVAEAVDSQQLVSRDSAQAADGFTTTNVLVAGVDEIDPVKYDGEYMYLANNDNIQVLKTNDNGSAAEVISRLNISIGKEGASYIRGLYLANDTVAAISGGHDVSWFADWFAPWNWNGKTQIDMVDVSDTETMTITETLEIDGTYVNSRRVGDTLYVTTRFTPELEDLKRPAETDEEREANQVLIDAAETDELLPTITYRDGSTEKLVSTENCFLPPTTDEEVQYPTLTTITAIDLTNPRDLTSVCLTDGIQGMHMSLDAIYLAALDNGRPGIGFYSNTIIHKFSIANEAPSYVGSGVLDGSFWGDPTFLMGEHEGNLTAVTTRQNMGERGFEHVLTILGESDKAFQLEKLGQIPNENSKDVIGKPGEQIFASRIFGDRAYIVTFQQVDPVYVIDLANPTDPKILGELEIPGFSTYLQPIGDNLLLGVGRDATDDERPLFKGINVRLFDVSDPIQLSVLSDISIGRRGTETPVSWNPHAFTMLFDPISETYKVTIPVRVHGEHVPDNDELEPWRYYPWTREALYMFEVQGDELRQTGTVVANDFDTGYRFAPNCCSWEERSFLNGDLVHYLRNNRLHTAFWDTPETVDVAFIPTVFDADEPGFCTEELRNGLNIGFGDRVTGERLSCAAVIATDGDFTTTVHRGCDENGDKGETLVAEGLYERPGTYDITVMHEGYVEWVGKDVVIQADQCHVQPTYIGVFLEPEEEEEQ